MELLLSSIDYKDPIWIAVAFLFGALSRTVGLPPLVGFLLAGFLLNYIGMQGGEFLNDMADLGVTLLLFSIGLKLKIKELLHVNIWGSAIVHMLIFGTISIAVLLLFKQTNLLLFAELSLVNVFIISFALSFSSTVFVVKTLEQRGDFFSKYGQIAIGILIIQDLLAVIYLGVTEVKIPSLWALVLIVLIFVGRPLIIKLSTKIGHTEMLLLFGLSMALGGAALFEAVDMKADLGALVFGVLLANTPKADELAKTLFGIKEIFLVGFFLSIGMAGLPDITTLIVAAILSLLLVVKSSLFFWILSLFKVRTFSAGNVAIALGNFSEFGLIVIIVAVSQQWIANDWLIVMAILVATSFMISAIFNKRFNDLYPFFKNRLKKFQHQSLAESNMNIDLTGVKILICGMGRVGSSTYEHLKNYDIAGLDFDEQATKNQSIDGRRIYYANMTDAEFWSQINITNSDVERILLCAPNIEVNKATAKLIRRWGFTGIISATSKYPDEEEELINSGVDTVFNIYAEAGAGFALHIQ